MTTKPDDFLLQVCKRQADCGMRMLEAVVEGSTRLHEIQRRAAAQAHADAETTRTAFAAAGDALQLLTLQAQWAQANAGKSLEYWRSVSQALMETQAALMKCAAGDGAARLPEPVLLGAVDSVYRQWLDAVQGLYQPAGKAAA